MGEGDADITVIGTAIDKAAKEYVSSLFGK